MLIDFKYIYDKYKIDNNKIILHIGAHLCEEREFYTDCGFNDENIFWFEGNEKIVNSVKTINNKIQIFNYLISDKDDEIVDFIITNNLNVNLKKKIV